MIVNSLSLASIFPTSKRDKTRKLGVQAGAKTDQPILFENDLRKYDFVGRIGGKVPRKGVFMWYDTKALWVISNYHGSDLVEVQRKQKNGRFKKKACPQAFADYGKYM